MSSRKRKAEKWYAREYHRKIRQAVKRILLKNPEDPFTHKPRNSAKWDAN